MGAQNRRGNEILQLHGKITHQEKSRDARGSNKPTKTKSTYKQAKPTDTQQTGSNPPHPDADGALRSYSVKYKQKRPGVVQVVHTHWTSYRGGWPKGFGALNSNPHSWIFASVSVSFRPRPYLFTSATDRRGVHTAQTTARYLADMWRSTRSAEHGRWYFSDFWLNCYAVKGWGETRLESYHHTKHSLLLGNTTPPRACPDTPDKSLSSEYQQAISFFGQNRDSSSKVGIPNTDLTIAVILPWLASKDRVRELWWNSVNKYHLCRCKDVYLRPLKVYQPQCQSN